jgi:hypothetical protein
MPLSSDYRCLAKPQAMACRRDADDTQSKTPTTCRSVRHRQRDYVILCDPKRVLAFAENPPKSKQFLAN